MRDCRHPNIIAYFGSYLRRGKLWICMEYCGGGSLQDIYQITGPLTEQQIAYMCKETLKGLEYLHTKNKMHRDIKGANILLTDNGDVKLADFGVSAQITATINKRRSFIGTPYWMVRIKKLKYYQNFANGTSARYLWLLLSEIVWLGNFGRLINRSSIRLNRLCEIGQSERPID